MAEDRVFYITTPIYYVNDRPHIGHAYCTVLADVLARYHRLFGEETFFLTGVDEHGQKVQEAAAKRGLSPQAHCDEMQAHFRNLWPTLHVVHDDFIRTTEPRHEAVVQEALQRLWDAGEIYRGEYEGFYSPRVEKFFTAEELVDGKCPETGGEVFRIQEANYFFRMSRYQDALIDHIRRNPDFIAPESRRNEVLGFLSQPLKDLCISRPKARLSWGIPLPFDPEFVTYVWFDALLNYCSAIGLYRDEERFRRLWSGAHHLIGKDILTTHSVYWTTMLMALGLPLPRRIIAHGWWLVDRTKMSKSLGNVVDPLSLKDRYGVDSLRYFLMREMVVGLDADFSEEAFLRRHNFDLANDLGNLVNRLVRFAERAFQGRVPPPADREVSSQDRSLREMAQAAGPLVRSLVEALRVEQAVEAAMNLVRRINRYLAETEPFKVVKEDPARAGALVYQALEALRIALTLLRPVMPGKCTELLKAIGADTTEGRLEDLRWGGLAAGTPLALEGAPFPRHEVPSFEGEPAAPAAEAPKAPASEGPALVSIEDFQKIQWKVGTVVSAAPVPGSDKLLALEVDLGEGAPRPLVAGIGKVYDPASLVGRQVVVVANLAPRKVFGRESRGMVLAASGDQGPVLLAPMAPVPPGTPVR
ncbi:MAG TPA: methionine--tRNA ligase [Myxococcota bacterium]|nr:methionine--tRNA ligase [Myxococcota bacterium]HQK49833.1 methionine--tRNA ligase [Myxococcota bacterium]